jgi:glycosyltransferase involved in cell wall biosynthesis
MAHQPEISVIIATFNRINVLEETLNRISAQSFPKDKYEVIVIDDGSEDGTPNYLKSLKMPIAISYIINKHNMGRAKTRNRGLKTARGKYVLMLDDDIWADKDLITKHYQEHMRHPEGVAVVGAIHASTAVQPTVINMYLSSHHNWCYNEMCRSDESLPYGFCKTASLSLPRKLIDKVGLFNEDFIKYGSEDSEFGYRLCRDGIKIVFAKEAIGYHFHDETIETLRYRFICLGESYNQFIKQHPEIGADEYKGFFSSNYHHGISARAITYNIIKLLLFNPLIRHLNIYFLTLVNDHPHRFFIKYLIPTIKMQWQHYGMKRSKT